MRHTERDHVCQILNVRLGLGLGFRVWGLGFVVWGFGLIGFRA